MLFCLARALPPRLTLTSILLAACAAPAPRAPDGTPLIPAPVQPVRLRAPVVDIRHYDIRADVDVRAGMVDGSVAVAFAALPGQPATHLQLDAVELQVRAAWDESGKPLDFAQRDDRLEITLPEPVPPGAESRVTVSYRAWPRRGLYFVGPSASEPQRPWHAWTQGETHETRHWVPVWDQPDDRATHTLAVTVDDRYLTMAAGERVASRRDEATGRRTDVWTLDVPHPSYLITLVAGDLAEAELPGASVPLPVVTDAASLPAARESLARTDDMLAMLAAWSGRTYPWPKYAQCLVHEFIAGGQENISATTLMHETLHLAQDAPQELEATENLAVHEVAHQWFGDLVTCRDWSHLWLNEGFATYAELLWARRTRSEDAARAMALGWQRQMVDADRAGGHPIVWTDYPEPDALFDTHTYEGAASRLHLLAAVLGDDVLRRGVQLYVREHEAESITTPELRAALEAASGRDLSRFFAEWIEGRGFPVFEVRTGADAAGEPYLVARQVQEMAGSRAVFHLPVHVAWSRGGVEHEAPLEVDASREELPLPGDGPLDWVRFDSRTVVPGEIDALQSETAWGRQLLGAADGVTRLVAAQWFAREAHVVSVQEILERPDGLQPDSLAALEQAARTDAFVPVREAALVALAGRSPPGRVETERALLDLASDPDPRVRAAAARGLSLHGGEGPQLALLALCDDPNADVVAQAFSSLVTHDVPGAFTLGRRLHEACDPLRWRLRLALLQSLARLPDASVPPFLVTALRCDPTPAVRAGALRLLRGLDDPPADVRYRLFGEALWDGSHVVRASAALALADWPAAASRPLLEARRALEIDADVLEALRIALADPE